MSKKPECIEDLTESLTEIYDDLKSGAADRKEANDAVNAAGKIIHAAKLKLEYNIARIEIPNVGKIDFLETKR